MARKIPSFLSPLAREKAKQLAGFREFNEFDVHKMKYLVTINKTTERLLASERKALKETKMNERDRYFRALKNWRRLVFDRLIDRKGLKRAPLVSNKDITVEAPKIESKRILKKAEKKKLKGILKQRKPKLP